MKLEIKKKIGNTEITFHSEIESHMDFFKELRFLYDLPSVCGKCKSPDLRVNYRTPLRNGKPCHYASVDCRAPACRYTLRFGVNQNEEKTLFSKGWEAPYKGALTDLPDSGTYEEPAPFQPMQPTGRFPEFSDSRRPTTNRPLSGTEERLARLAPQAPTAPKQVQPEPQATEPETKSMIDKMKNLKKDHRLNIKK